MGRTVKVAACQLTPRLGDCAYNLARALEYIARAAARGVDIICFPELYYTGYDLPRQTLLELAEPQDGALFQALSRAAREHKIHIIMGYPEKTLVREAIYFSVMTIDDDGVRIGNHRKTYLWKEEKENAKQGDSYRVIETKFGKIATLICYEMEYPELSRLVCMQGAQLLFFSSAYMGVHLMSRYLGANALQNLVHVVGVNTVGHGKNGFSQVVDQLGNIVASASRQEEELLVAELDLDTDVRREFPHWHDLKRDPFALCLHEADRWRNERPCR